MNAPLSGGAPDYFGAMVREYDDLIRRAVPRYDEMIHVLLRFLPVDPPARILELGTGTGNLTLRLTQRYPRAEITTVDASSEMIDLARARIREAQPSESARITFATARFEEFEAKPDSFDLITSCISLHHVVDKAPLYARFYRWLAPGGSLRFADQFRGATEEHHAKIWNDWQEHCRQPGMCAPEELQSLIDHAEAHDHYEPLGAHVAHLEASGFPRDRVDAVWRHLLWTVVLADKPRGAI